MVNKEIRKTDIDSGYHGISDDDTDVDKEATAAPEDALLSPKQQGEVCPNLLQPPLHITEKTENPEDSTTQDLERARTTDGSFHSAEETVPNQKSAPEAPDELAPEDMEIDSAILANTCDDYPRLPHCVEAGAQSAPEDAMDLGGLESESILEETPNDAASHSSSEGSSPAKTLVRKSSLSFAALPAREPLTTKRSLGARVSGTTYHEQPRATINGGSLLGRYTGGKSIGSSRPLDRVQIRSDDEMDVDEAEKPALTREESDGETKMTRLHNKSSTQRLHEKINMLGKSQPARLTKSIPAAAIITQPNYPDLPAIDSRPSTNEQAPAKTRLIEPSDNNDDEDDDDWIQPPPKLVNGLNPPLSPKNLMVDVMKDISGKQNISDKQLEGSNHDQEAGREPSPSQQDTLLSAENMEKDELNSINAYAFKSPAKSDRCNHLDTIEILQSTLESTRAKTESSKMSNTPITTPSTKRHVDGPLSASKSKLQSIMKTARGIFTSSAGLSAQAKMETMSPHSMRTRGKAREPAMAENSGIEPCHIPQVDEPSSAAQSIKGIQATASTNISDTSTKENEGRKTRSSSEKEEKRKEKEANEQERAREVEEQGGTTQNQDRHHTLLKTRQKIEVEEVKVTNHRQPARPIRQSPRRPHNQREMKKAAETSDNQLKDVDSSAAHVATAQAPNSTQPQSSQYLRSKDLRRPAKLAKEAAPKPKPQPVAIRVGTLSQRIPLTNAAISSSLQESLPPPPVKQPGQGKKASAASLQTSISGSSLKSSVSSNAPKPKALLAAERKKEQVSFLIPCSNKPADILKDEKEVQRKLEQKREIERKRAAQQEESRRQEQAQRQEAERQRERERAAAAEDPKKLAQRQAIEKRRLEVGKKEQQRQIAQQEKSQPLPTSIRHEIGSGRPPSRLHTTQEYSKSHANQPLLNPARPPIKRVFESENDDDSFRSGRMQGGPPYQQADAKRRRTEDEVVHETVVRPAMAPPIRQSNIRKVIDLNFDRRIGIDVPQDAFKQSIYGNGHTSAQQASNPYHHPSMVKTSTLNHTYQQHQNSNLISRTGMPAEMVTYTNGKIPFAEAPNPPNKSPRRSKQATAAHAKSSPQCVNGENIELEEIQTDEDDEDDEDEKPKDAMVADWAKSPFLKDQLETQERFADPDEIFGPVGSPHMEEMFKGREYRYRNRTSSANWAGSDRLTEEEIRSDRAAREQLRRQGGWTFGL